MNNAYLFATIILVIAIIVLGANFLIHYTPRYTGYFTATPTGTADVNVTVSQAVSLVITTGSSIGFGSLNVSDSNSTAGGTGVILENNGSVDVNVKASSDGFFTSTNVPAWAVSSLTCKSAASNGGNATGWQATYVDCYNAAEPNIINCLDYANSTDEARVDLNVTVPTDEPQGLKTGQVTFTASSC